MSKGGAGKVYFVLYLAVVLELLIIIVERDEAEESLHLKQKETMRIVQSILSQLQTGAGSEGINTRPQDRIIIPHPDTKKELMEIMNNTELKIDRSYVIEVGVTDIGKELPRKEDESTPEYQRRISRLFELGNVEEITYEIYFTEQTGNDTMNVPLFPTSKQELKEFKLEELVPEQSIEYGGQIWTLKTRKTLLFDNKLTESNATDVILDEKRTMTPLDIDPIYNDSTVEGSTLFTPENMDPELEFYYCHEETVIRAPDSNSVKKRAFVVNFQPPYEQQGGWYKLRFSSRTNRILGVSSSVINLDEIDPSTTVNIGTVQLSVKDLREVQKELRSKVESIASLPPESMLIQDRKIDEWEEAISEAKRTSSNDLELQNNIQLYDYITKLLAPGQSINFDQNKGSIEFNVGVTMAKPSTVQPTVILQDTVYSFSPAPPAFEFTISPYQGPNANKVVGRIVETNQRITCEPTNITESGGEASRGNPMKYRGIADGTLNPGNYTLEVTHEVSGRTVVVQSALQIFEPKLVNEEELTTRLGYLTIYGYSISDITFNPPSAGAIKANQFRIKMMTDNNQQLAPLSGLSIPRDRGLFLDASATTFSMKLSWLQPVTNKEVEIYSFGPSSISQNSPLVNLNNISTNTEDKGSKKMQVLARNLRIVKPVDGGGDNSEADISVTVKGDFTGGLEGKANFIMEPEIRELPDGSYEIEAMIQVNPAQNEKKLQGFVTLSIQAIAVNSVNSKTSTPVNKTYDIPITYEVEEQGGGWGPSPW
jgi:hypothetical protein